MKKIIAIIGVLSLTMVAQAGLTDWISDLYFTAPATGVANGTIVALYQDVDGDNTGAWNSALTQMLVNTDLTVASGFNGMGNDLFLGFTTMAVPFPSALSLNAQSLDLADNIEIYTVLFNASTISGLSLGAIDDAVTFNSGSVSAPDQALIYNLGSNAANGLMGGNAANGLMGGVGVVPEPATALLFGIGGVGAFIVRRNKKKTLEEADA